VETVMQQSKRVAPVKGRCALSGTTIAGYEIHMGNTYGPDTEYPFAEIDGKPEGARCAGGLIEGSYLHGVFANDAFRRAWVTRAGGVSSASLSYGKEVERALNHLADEVEKAVDVDRLFAQSRAPGWSP
ncbi:MAG: cobyric acid synthase CobQ, partial [Pseudomonadota bacterium]